MDETSAWREGGLAYLAPFSALSRHLATTDGLA